MTTLSDLLLGTTSDIVRIDVVVITHRDFAAPYFLQNAIIDGADFTVPEHGVQSIAYAPFRVQPIGERSVLERGIDIELGDIGNIAITERMALEADDGYRIKPQLTWMQYRSDVLTGPVFGPETFVIDRFSRQDRATRIEARAASLNANSSGERYTLDRFPMQMGL